MKLTPQERDDLRFACALAKERLLELIQASDENLIIRLENLVVRLTGDS
jgi:hypothetical protein